LKWLRITAGLAACAAILYAATLATRDCSVTPYFAANCFGIWAKNHLGLPPNHILRALILEVVGLILAAALYLTIRYVLPHRKKRRMVEPPSATPVAADEISEAGSIINTERLVLAALVQAPPEDAVRERAKSLLARYRWREPIHQEIFRALCSTPGHDPATLQERLPALLTRRGFPEFDLAGLLKPQEISFPQVIKLIDSLMQNP
jgi:hypothetical protein